MWSRFEYAKPPSLKAALECLTEYGDGAAIFSGGTDLLVSMREGSYKPKYLIDIKAIPQLKEIKKENGKLTIGSAVTWSSLVKSETVAKEFDIFVEVADVFGSPQIKNMASVGGNICSASPSCDLGPTLLVLDAKVVAVSPGGERDIAIKDFFLDRRQSALQKKEVLREIQVESLPSTMSTAFLKIRRSGVDIAIVNAAVAASVSGGRFEDIRIALGGVAPRPIRLPKTEEQLRGEEFSDKNIARAAETLASEISPISDLRASAEYRTEMSKVLVRRAIKSTFEKVGG